MSKRAADATEHAEEPGDEAEGPGFAAALDELNVIVAELESDALDVDHLAERVARAAELVTLCRARIDGARFAVEQVLEDMDQGVAAPDDLDAETD